MIDRDALVASLRASSFCDSAGNVELYGSAEEVADIIDGLVGLVGPERLALALHVAHIGCEWAPVHEDGTRYGAGMLVGDRDFANHDDDAFALIAAAAKIPRSTKR